MTKQRVLQAALAACVWLALSPIASSAHAQAQTPQLLADTAIPAIDHPADNPTVARRRPIQIDATGLTAVRNGQNFTLHLFADVALPAVVDRAWQSDADTWHWQGHTPGELPRSVIMVLHRGALWATINAHGVPKYRIRSHQNMGQVVEEIIEKNFSPCGCTKEHEISPLLQARAGAVAPEGGIAGTPTTCRGENIDVMVMYSPEARDEEGGTAAIQALALALEDATNNTYLNSEILQRIHIVHVAETLQSELSGFNATLNALTDLDDGLYDEVHPLRDQHGADLVAMLISHTNGNICGIGWLMTEDDITPAFAVHGFTVTNTGCASGGYTFQHELGHNMGAHHDHDNSSPAGAFTWSHGHRFEGTDGELYRTVMSYAPGMRIGYFSNPDILYQGVPTGVPIGTPNTEADNANTLNATASAVAAFRDPRSPITPPTPPRGSDCNNNGVPDECDISSGTSPDINGNNIPDECESPPPSCPADVTPPGGNGTVGVDDLLFVITHWGACDPPLPCPGNIITSGSSANDVDVDDLLAVITGWGNCP